MQPSSLKRIAAVTTPRRACAPLRAVSGFAAAVLAAAANISGCADPKNKFTGIWKADCKDYWGVQIKPAEDAFYSVTFCGLSGCMPPGAWLPNSRIEDDPMYQVVSATEIRIRRNDSGYFTYAKCDTDPVWKVAEKNG